MKLTHCLFLCFLSSTVWAKDPFLSPFEPKAETQKQKEGDTKKPDDKEAYAIEIEKKLDDIVKALQSEELDKAKSQIETLASQNIPVQQKKKLDSLQDELDNYKKIQAQLSEYKNTITIQGKMILAGKKNILMINGQPVSEGDTLSETLKIESHVVLQEVQEDFYRIRLNNVSLKLSY